jgi:hypothetical protein
VLDPSVREFPVHRPTHYEKLARCQTDQDVERVALDLVW